MREAPAVRAEARARKQTVHFGRIVELRFEKNAEMPEGHPARKLKGRSVFLGDNVVDQDF